MCGYALAAQEASGVRTGKLGVCSFIGLDSPFIRYDSCSLTRTLLRFIKGYCDKVLFECTTRIEASHRQTLIVYLTRFIVISKSPMQRDEFALQHDQKPEGVGAGVGVT